MYLSIVSLHFFPKIWFITVRADDCYSAPSVHKNYMIATVPTIQAMGVEPKVNIEVFHN